MIRIRTLALGAALFCACAPGLDTPEGTQIVCTSNEDCITGFVCVTDIGRCVPAGDEKDPPTFENVVLSHAAATVGVDVTLDFDASERLFTVPDVVLISAAGDRIPWELQSEADLHYTFGFRATGSEFGVTYDVAATAVDTAGNSARDVVLGTLTLDFVSPTIASIVSSRDSAQLGELVTLTLRVNEPLGSATITLDDGTVLPSIPTSDPLEYDFDYTPMAGDPEGPRTVRCDVSDVAGNPASANVDGLFALDFSAPTLASFDVPVTVARAGITIVASFDASESLVTSPPPVVELSPQGGGSLIVMELESASAVSFVFAHTVSGVDIDDTYDINLVSFEDPAGNTGTPASLGSVTIDKAAPTVTSSTTPGALSPLQVFEVSVALDEPLGEDPSLLFEGGTVSDLLVLRGTPVAGFDYTFDGQAPSSSTTPFFTLTLTMEDVAGNPAIVPLGSLQVDVVAPELVSLQAAPDSVKRGDTVRVVLAANEPLSGPPALSATNGGTTAIFAVEDATAGRLSYAYTYLVQMGDPEGAYAIDPFDLTDLATNQLAVSAPGESFTVDASAPNVSMSTLTTDNAYSAGAAIDGDTVTAVAVIDEVIAAPPTALLGGIPMSLVDTVFGAMTTTVTFELVASSGDGDGSKLATLTVTDDVGNQTVADLGTLVFDFTPPSFASGTVSTQLIPGTANLLNTVSAVTNGTTIRITFNLSENIRNSVPGFPPTPRVSLLGNTFNQSSRTGTLYVYEWVANGLAADLDSTSDIVLLGSPAMEDLYGNLATGDLTLGTVDIDTTRPSVPDTTLQASGVPRIVYTRTPWRNSGNGGPPVFELNGVAGSVPPSVTLFAFSGADVEMSSRVGSAVSTGSGSFGPLTLDPVDRALVYLVAVDDAGNRSDPTGNDADPIDAVLVADVAWTVSLADKVAFSNLENPHSASLTLSQRPTRLQSSQNSFEFAQPDVDAVADIGGALATYSGEREWSIRVGSDVFPDPRYRAPLAYDSSRGVVVLYGGIGACDGSTASCDDTWEWDGFGWEEKTPFGLSPGERSSHNMVYDPSRGRVVLFGGGGASGSNDTWEWDGNQWQNLTPASGNPSSRFHHGMTYEPTTGRVLMFGGANLGDMWGWEEWGSPTCADPTQPCWSQLAPTGSGPLDRIYGRLAYLPDIGEVVLFGGRRWSSNCNTGTRLCNDTWHWDGDSWQENTQAGTPPTHPCAGSLSYDPTVGGLVYFGGTDDSNCSPSTGETTDTTWAYGLWGMPTCPSAGAPCWRQIVTADAPTEREHPKTVYDPVNEELLLFGGNDRESGVNCIPNGTSGCGDTWVFDGTNWKERPLSADRPGERANHGLAYDSLRDEALLFGGIGPNYSCAVAPCRKNDTWRWTGNVWLEACTPSFPCTAEPSERQLHTLAYDASRDRVVLFGGNTGTYNGETWEWDGSDWTQMCAPGDGADACAQEPQARQSAAMVYDSGRSVVVMFGGFAGGNCDGETTMYCRGTWEWGMWGAGICDNGSAGPCWRDANPGTEPTSRTTAMSYDSERGVTVLFGGNQSATQYDDTWEWNGTNWTERCTIAPCSTARPTARTSHTMSFDPQRERVVMFGGEGSELWEWDGTSWVEMTAAAVSPSALTATPMISRTARNELMMFGGSLGQLFTRDTWVLQTAPDSRPAITFDVNFSQAGASRTEVLAVELTAAGGATGYATVTPGVGGAIDGAQMIVWDYNTGAWVPLITGSAAAGGSDTFGYSTATAVEAGRYVSPNLMTFGVRPGAGLGTGPALPALTADYFEATIHYRIGYVGACGDGLIHGQEECEPPGTPGCALDCTVP